MDKTSDLYDAISTIPDNATVMIGGFAGIGAPLKSIAALAAWGCKNLTLITVLGSPVGGKSELLPLFQNRQVRKLISANVTSNPTLLKMCERGELELELHPMGNWIEKVRAGGAGLGGILTPVGVNTVFARPGNIVTIKGKQYLMEMPLKADFALVKAYRADYMGNLEYRPGAISSHQVIATAANYTIAEVNEIVNVGQIDPIRVGTPGVFVQAVVQGYSLNGQHHIMRHKRDEETRSLQ